jgi:hypothetical protein
MNGIQLLAFIITPLAVMALGALVAGYAMWAAKHDQ